MFAVERFIFLVLCSALCGACSSSTAPTDAGVDAPVVATCTLDVPTVCDPGTGGETLLFAFSRIAFADRTGPASDMSDGFDLDQTGETVCGVHDFTQPGLPATCGIDNQFGPVGSSLVGTAPQMQVESGDALYLVELRGVDDRMNDGCVGVRTAVAVLRAGTLAPMLAADRTLAPGQTFDVESRSVTADGLTWTSSFAAARIVGGRLEAAAGETTWPFPVASRPTRFRILLHGARFTATLGADGLHGGVLGGSSLVDDVIAALRDDPMYCPYVPTFEALLATNADLDPQMVVTDAGMLVTRCRSISMVVDFDAVPVAVSSCSTDATCGIDRRCIGGHCSYAPADVDAGAPCH